MPRRDDDFERAARVLVVLPGGVVNEFYDCDVETDLHNALVHLHRGGSKLVTAPLDVCIIFWIDDAAAASPARVTPLPRRDSGFKRPGEP
jgi:hypothetical protein